MTTQSSQALSSALSAGGGANPLLAGASLLGGLVSGGVKFATGLQQRRRARRLRREAQREFDRNPFRTPVEALQALSSSQNLASQTRLPGQDLLEAQFTGAAGGAIQAGRETAVTPQDVAAQATQAYQNLYVNPLQNLGVQAAQNYAANQQGLQDQLGNVARYRTQEWEQNVLMPYQRAMQTAGSLATAGQHNIFGGIDSALAGGIGAAAAASSRNDDYNPFRRRNMMK